MERNKFQKMIAWAGSKQKFNWLSDEYYLRLMFWARMNRKLNLESPEFFNDKVQWLKLNDRKKEYISIVDKYEVRKYISQKLGEKYLIPLVGGPWESFDEIDFSQLPSQFVLKCTHDSGGVVVCKDKKSFDKKRAKEKIEKSLKRNYYKYSREWPYKHVPHRIIAEQYLTDDAGDELKDYKILCFNGIPDNIMVCTGRFAAGVKYYFFDKNWNFLRYDHGDDELPDNFSLKKPDHLEEMFEVAKILSRGFDLARIDLYEAQGRVWFGEITLYPDSGFDTDILCSTDRLFGKKLNLTMK